MEKLQNSLGVVVNEIMDRNSILINEDTYFEQIVTFNELVEMYIRVTE